MESRRGFAPSRLTRHGLALDQANLLQYGHHESWVERLMEIRRTTPPAGYASVTHQQLLNADGKLFVKLAELTRTGVQLVAGGRPLDLVWEEAVDCPNVAHLLQPMPSPPQRELKERPTPYSTVEGKGKRICAAIRVASKATRIWRRVRCRSSRN